ncbi:MAG: hypothetical protein COW30_14560 [Rhodospirillales bacterium CG15_BIG_FIL_POST_REV_8_21_14_020_66_15]|nr:MAG: hypothetical protein COW30_14560 [Rhodospirillales bacterium CG15_BIG_FIL_POST_REV_8_21_14_020_66_15]
MKRLPLLHPPFVTHRFRLTASAMDEGARSNMAFQGAVLMTIVHFGRSVTAATISFLLSRTPIPDRLASIAPPGLGIICC